MMCPIKVENITVRAGRCGKKEPIVDCAGTTKWGPMSAIEGTEQWDGAPKLMGPLGFSLGPSGALLGGRHN